MNKADFTNPEAIPNALQYFIAIYVIVSIKYRIEREKQVACYQSRDISTG